MPTYNDTSHAQLITQRCISMVGSWQPGEERRIPDSHSGFSPLVCRSRLYCHVGFNTVSARVPQGRQWIYYSLAFWDWSPTLITKTEDKTEESIVSEALCTQATPSGFWSPDHLPGLSRMWRLTSVNWAMLSVSEWGIAWHENTKQRTGDWKHHTSKL